MKAIRTSLSSLWKLVAFFTAVLIIGSQPTLGQNGAVGIAFPAKGITIDGDLADWPKGLQTYSIERVEFGDILGGKDDLKADFRVAYNAGERALYVAIEARDDSIVLDGHGEPEWKVQDGVELYIDALNSGSESPVIKYARYGNHNRVFGPSGASEKTMQVAVARSDSRIVYEWRIDLGVDLDGDRTIGFDISVHDKDQDGSFSWVPWGRGADKDGTPDRRGEMLLVSPGTRFGEVSGRVAWKDPSPSALPSRVRIQSARSAPLARAAIIDSTGSYKATNLPVGPYSIHAVDSADNRVEDKPHVDVVVEADQTSKAELLRVMPVPWPGLIGAEGVLRGHGAVNTDELDRFMQTYLDYYKIPGISLAVIKDSRVVYHRGFGVKNSVTKEPVTDDTVFEAASMTKPVFAYTVLRLVDQGLLKLDSPLYNYFPYEDIAHDERYKLITSRMVLTHRTGFPNWRSGKLEIKFTPGTQVSYSGEGFVYLGKVVEHLTGKKLVDLCREEVFLPLGIDDASLVWNNDVEHLTATGHNLRSPLSKWKPSQPNTAASLHVNAKNYAKFLIAVLQGKGLAEPTAKEMLRAQVKVPDEKGQSWGLGIAIEETPFGTNYGHGGRNTGFTSRSLMYKDQGIGYVFLVNNYDASKIDNVLNAYLIAGKSGLKETRPVAHKLAKVDPKVYDAYAGRYEIERGGIITITREGDHLMSQVTNEGKSEILPESETVFFLNPASDATVTFVKDDKGNVAHVVLHHDGHDTKAKRLPPQTTTPPHAANSSSGIALDDVISSEMRMRQVPGLSLAIIQEGKIVKAQGYGTTERGGKTPVTARTLFQAGSISKPVSALGALRLVEQGKIALDEDVNTKLVTWKVPENEFTKDKKVTLRGLLSHTAGLTVHGFPGYATDEPRPTLVQVLEGAKPANTSPIRVDIQPGSQWRYSGGGYTVMQQLVIDVTGTPFPQFMQEAVLGPLDMKESTFEQPLPDDKGNLTAAGHLTDRKPVKGRWHIYPEMAAAGLWTTPSDLARFAVGVQEALAGKSTKTLSPAVARQMLTEQKNSYGLGVGVEGHGTALRFGHGGRDNGFDARLVAYAEIGQGAAVMINVNDNSGMMSRILEAVAREYHWPEYPMVDQARHPVAQISKTDLVALAGRYELANNHMLTLVTDQGRLITLVDGLPDEEFVPAADNRFHLAHQDVQVTIIKGNDGSVTGLLWKADGKERKVPRIGSLFHSLEPSTDPDPTRTEKVVAALRALGQGGKASADSPLLTPGARADFGTGHTVKDLSDMRSIIFLAEQDVAGRMIERHKGDVSRVLHYRLVKDEGNRFVLVYLTADGLITDYDLVED